MNAESLALEDGIHARIPIDVYTSIPACNITRLKEMRKSPLHYRHRLLHKLASDFLRLGTAGHVATLEPERFETQFAVWERRTAAGAMSPRRGEEWDKFCAAHPGRTIITLDQAEAAMAIALAVRADPVAAPYLESGEPEVAMTWCMGDRRCKGRVDWLTSKEDRPVLVGLKSAADIGHLLFGNQAARMGYHLQWAYYADGYAAIKGIDPHVVEIVVESAPPHAVGVYMIPEDVILQGRQEYLELLELLDKCERTDTWPGPFTTEQMLTLPTWAYKRDDGELGSIGLEFASEA